MDNLSSRTSRHRVSDPTKESSSLIEGPDCPPNATSAGARRLKVPLGRSPNAEPPAACGQTLCISSGMSVGKDWLTWAHQATLQIALTTPLDPSTFQRQPMNLVVVVDHSGSMASDGRLDKVKAGLHTMITNLQDTDRLAIVQFDDQIDVLFPFVSGIFAAR